ncbi:MAG TPA: GNAT family protein [Candidatus Sulfotelmatobacter sp.]
MHLKMTELETERLRLREFRPADLPLVAVWEGTAHTEKFLEFCLQSYRQWGMGPWALVKKPTGEIVGNCGFCRIGYEPDAASFEYCGEVNYYIAPPDRRQGFASEALPAIVSFGFDNLRLTRIQGRCSPTNVGSERVMLKAGLQFERMIPAAEDSLPDEKLYAITREGFHLK